MKHGARHAVLFAGLCLAASQGLGHDSWLSPSRAAAPPGQIGLELATGNRYPVQEFSQAPDNVVRSACTDGTVTLPLRPTHVRPKWLDLVVPAPQRPRPVSCWVELGAVETEIKPRAVNIYFAEIRASAAHRDAWAAIQARGLPWRETYRKFARIELAAAGDGPPMGVAASRRPVGLDLEIVVLGEQAIAVGQPLEFQVLRDGLPLAGFPVELVSEHSPLGVWGETDSAGKLRHRLPFAGRWLLRGTDLRVSARDPDRWESRFVTLAIEAH